VITEFSEVHILKDCPDFERCAHEVEREDGDAKSEDLRMLN